MHYEYFSFRRWYGLQKPNFILKKIENKRKTFKKTDPLS